MRVWIGLSCLRMGSSCTFFWTQLFTFWLRETWRTSCPAKELKGIQDFKTFLPCTVLPSLYVVWGVLKTAVFANQWSLTVGVTFYLKTHQTGLTAIHHEICLTGFNWLILLQIHFYLQFPQPHDFVFKINICWLYKLLLIAQQINEDQYPYIYVERFEQFPSFDSTYNQDPSQIYTTTKILLHTIRRVKYIYSLKLFQGRTALQIGCWNKYFNKCNFWSSRMFLDIFIVKDECIDTI
jgi:hypothetical protein